MNKKTIAMAAAVFAIIATSVIVTRSPSTQTPFAQTGSDKTSEDLSHAMTFTPPAGPKK